MLSVTVLGIECPIYNHKGFQYIAVVPGTEYELKVKNNSYRRILAVPSVDGINTLTGKEATKDSTGYVISGNSTLNIKGWTINENEVSAFKFSNERNYATYVTGHSNNVGVLSILVFEEKVNLYKDFYEIDKPYKPWCDKPVINPPEYPRSRFHYGKDSVTRSIACSASTSDNKVGTDWGSKQNFNTKNVTFDKSEAFKQYTIYYDTYNNLVAKGVIVESSPMPQPFKDLANECGCKVPHYWNN